MVKDDVIIFLPETVYFTKEMSWLHFRSNLLLNFLKIAKTELVPLFWYPTSTKVEVDKRTNSGARTTTTTPSKFKLSKWRQLQLEPQPLVVGVLGCG